MEAAAVSPMQTEPLGTLHCEPAPKGYLTWTRRVPLVQFQKAVDLDREIPSDTLSWPSCT